MARMPYAAKVFTDQVKGLRKSAKFEVGDEDGLGVYRTVTFDKATTRWLGHALDYIEDDRIVGYSVTKDQMTVLFSHRHIADSKEPFLVEDAVTVAADEKP